MAGLNRSIKNMAAFSCRNVSPKDISNDKSSTDETFKDKIAKYKNKHKNDIQFEK